MEERGRRRREFLRRSMATGGRPWRRVEVGEETRV
jgi:hypothetical protein